MVYDVVIRNGTIVDGSGLSPFRGDVAILGDKIVEIGEVTDSSRKVIDATDLVVAPGFVDPHTHYDAQIWWDQKLTPSSWHGVTTVVMGNCGIGIAPCRPSAREEAIWDLVNVEAIPFDVLSKGISWEWETFPEFIAAADKRRFGANVGFLCPLTPFRKFVMGDAASERAANAQETKMISTHLREAIEAGALGWSTSVGNHIGYKGRPIASRLADAQEMASYARVLHELGAGSIELLVNKKFGFLADDEYDLLELLSRSSSRPITWTALVDRPDHPDAARQTLRQSEPLIDRGVIPQILPLPMFNEMNLVSPAVFAGYPSWKGVFNASRDEALAIYSSDEFRQSFRDDLEDKRGTFSGDWDSITVHAVGNPELQSLAGQTIRNVALQRSADPLDTFFDIAIADELKTDFIMALFNVDEQRAASFVSDPRLLLGLGDAGAHVDMHDNSGYPTYVLGTWSRDRGVLSLQEAVRRLTSQPAEFWGLAGRGRIELGYAADFCVFDYATIGSSSIPPIMLAEWRNDLPGSGRRLTWPMDSGVRHTIVNGVVTHEEGTPTDALPGRVLRG